MESKASRSTITVIFIASLLLHSTLGLLILTMKYAQEHKAAPADVVFYEEPQKTSPNTVLSADPATTQQQLALTQNKGAKQAEMPKEDDFFKNFPQILPNSSSTSAAMEPPQSMPGQSLTSAPIDQKVEHESQESQTQEQEQTESAAQEIVTENQLNKTVDDATTFNEQHEKIEEQTKSAPAKKQTATDGSYGVDAQTKKVTLDQIAQSFLQEARNNNPNRFETSAHIEGDTSALPNGKHFAFARYWEKINYHVINELKLHYGQYEHECSKRWPSVFYLNGTMTLNKQGQILAASLTSSTGNPDLDAFLLATLQEASSSFPPIPNSLGLQTLNVPWRWPLPKPEPQSRLRRI